MKPQRHSQQALGAWEISELVRPPSLQPGVRCSARRTQRHDEQIDVREQKRIVSPGQPHERVDNLSLSRRETQPQSPPGADRKSTRLNSSHSQISYAVF